MADILPFRKPDLKQKAKGKTLCSNGLHKWRIVQEKQFDVRQGRLVTVYRCTRCNAEKSEAR
ncbi:MAG: hypothetical protein IT488_11765 [Gammaproteobacteria bacterium]|nr:hypothetical protein [Gammaproteobacteria bacterium]